MGFDHIALETGPVATVTLRRPQARNAMSDVTLKELASCFKSLSRDKNLRAVVVRGEGPDFCAGADIEWMRRAGRLKGAAAKKDARLLLEMGRSVQSCPVPVIARVHGNVFGGGLGLVAACDVAVAAEEARMCFSECRLGILPAVISCFVIPKMGEAAARRYYLTAEVFGARTAKELGIVHEVAPEAELDGRVQRLVEAVRRNGPQAVRAAKALLLKFPSLSFERRAELVVDTLVRLRGSPEGQEGLGAFLEKRAPSWAS